MDKPDFQFVEQLHLENTRKVKQLADKQEKKGRMHADILLRRIHGMSYEYLPDEMKDKTIDLYLSSNKDKEQKISNNIYSYWNKYYSDNFKEITENEPTKNLMGILCRITNLDLRRQYREVICDRKNNRFKPQYLRDKYKQYYTDLLPTTKIKILNNPLLKISDKIIYGEWCKENIYKEGFFTQASNDDLFIAFSYSGNIDVVNRCLEEINKRTQMEAKDARYTGSMRMPRIVPMENRYDISPYDPDPCNEYVVNLDNIHYSS